jgi:predicted PurR-regulated permease PerM
VAHRNEPPGDGGHPPETRPRWRRALTVFLTGAAPGSAPADGPPEPGRRAAGSGDPARAVAAADGTDDATTPRNAPPAGGEPGVGDGALTGPGTAPDGSAGSRTGTDRLPAVARVPAVVVFRWAIATALGFLVVALAAQAVYTVRAVLVRVLIALFIATSLDPAVRWLVGRGVRRPVAVAVIFFVAALLFASFIWSVTPVLIEQASNLAKDVPGYVEDLSERSRTFREFADRYGLTEKIVGYASTASAQLGSNAVDFAQQFLGAVFNLLLVVVLTIYFMADLPRMRIGVVRLVPQDHRPRAAEAVNVVIDKVGGYMIGNLIISFFAGISTFLFLTAMEVPFALPLAFFVAVTDLIPMIGATIGAAGGVLIAVFTVGLWPGAVVVLLFFIAYQQVENYLIAPRVLRNAVDLSSTAVLIAALLGGALLGLTGALMAIPITAAAKVLMTPMVRALDEPRPSRVSVVVSEAVSEAARRWPHLRDLPRGAGGWRPARPDGSRRGGRPNRAGGHRWAGLRDRIPRRGRQAGRGNREPDGGDGSPPTEPGG